MAIYYVWSGATGSGNGSSWANAAVTLTAGFVLEAAGDTVYVAHDHAESTASAITLTSSGTLSNPTKVVCASRSGSVPPVSADRRTTATVTTTAAGNISLAGSTHYDGIIFNCNGLNFIIPSAGQPLLRFDNCSLRNTNAGASARFYLGNAGAIGGTYVQLNNTTVSFSHASQAIDLTSVLEWRNTPSALIGTVPTSLFVAVTAARGAKVECVGVDLSAMGSGKTIVNMTLASISANAFRFIDCKLDAAVTKSAVPPSVGSADIDFVRSGASGNYNVFRHRISGTLDQETTIVRSGGATDGTTPVSWKVVSTANCTYSLPFECPPIAIWNDTTGSAKTATVECIAAAIMTDQEIWLDLEYLGDASSPQGSFVNDAKADLLATAANQTSSSATWGGSTTPFKLNVTFTAQQKGWVYARVKVGKASSTVYIDPLITLT